MTAPADAFAVLTREAWARLGGAPAGLDHAGRATGSAAPTGPVAEDPGRRTPPGPGTSPPTTATTWAGEVDVDAAERDEVLAPLALLVAVRRDQDLRARAALRELDGALVRGGASATGWVVGIAGGVASGKSTVGRELAALLEAGGHGPVVRVATDDFLLPNAELERRGITARKGFPESYDEPALLDLLRAVREGGPAIEVPVYAHRLQERDPERTTTVDGPAILVLEGLRALAGPASTATDDGAGDDGPGPAVGTGVRDLVDLGIYVDAAEEDAFRWYMERFAAWRVAAADDPGALLHQIADWPDERADDLAVRAWEDTNAPNVREHVLPTRGSADVILEKGPDHRVERVQVRQV